MCLLRSRCRFSVIQYCCFVLFSKNDLAYKHTMCKAVWHDLMKTGLQTSQDARFYALSSRFDDFSNKGEPLVVQFTVKHEQSIDCGGGYVKVFPSDLKQEAMHGDSVYNLMFGTMGSSGSSSGWVPHRWVRWISDFCVQVLIFADPAQRKFTSSSTTRARTIWLTKTSDARWVIDWLCNTLVFLSFLRN